MKVEVIDSGFVESRSFGAVIGHAKMGCCVSGHTPSDHFVDVNIMVYACLDCDMGTRRAPISARWQA